jgi:hypothetical protein
MSEEQATQATQATQANTNVIPTSTVFHFRSKDPATGEKRASITKDIPLLTLTGIISIIEAGDKGVELLLDTVNSVIIDQAREQFDSTEFLTTGEFPAGSLDWATIAAIPKAERTGNGIPKEVWTAFAKDYAEVMPQAIEGLKVEQAVAAAKLFVARLAPVKTNKPMVSKLGDRLNTWFASTPNAEVFAAVYEVLSAKVEALLAADDASLLENI